MAFALTRNLLKFSSDVLLDGLLRFASLNMGQRLFGLLLGDVPRLHLSSVEAINHPTSAFSSNRVFRHQNLSSKYLPQTPHSHILPNGSSHTRTVGVHRLHRHRPSVPRGTSSKVFSSTEDRPASRASTCTAHAYGLPLPNRNWLLRPCHLQCGQCARRNPCWPG